MTNWTDITALEDIPKLGSRVLKTDTVNIARGIGAGEGGPQEIIKVGGHKCRIVAEDDQREGIGRNLFFEFLSDSLHLRRRNVVVGKGRAADREDAGRNDGAVEIGFPRFQGSERFPAAGKDHF